jgi:hypothetical protein
MRHWSRREVLQTAAAASLAAAIPARGAGADSLDALAKAKGLHFGSALGGRGLNASRYLDLIRAECGIPTFHNHYQPKPLREAIAAAFRAAPPRKLATMAGIPA